MAKRQVWLTEEQVDLTVRVIDFALREIAKEQLGGRAAWFSMEWTKASLNRLRAIFAPPEAE